MRDRLRRMGIVMALASAPACGPDAEIAGDWVLVETELADYPSSEEQLTLDLRRTGKGSYTTVDLGSNGGGNIDHDTDVDGVHHLVFWQWSHLHEKETVATLHCEVVEEALVCEQGPAPEGAWFDRAFRSPSMRFERT